MTPADPTAATAPFSSHWFPYVVVGVGLLLGLLVVLLEPLPWPLANYLIGGALIAAGAGSVMYLIARDSGPGSRGPDF